MCSILLVEDHRDTRQAFATLLKSWGHKVAATESADGGLTFLDEHEVDVILSDIGLPDQDGYEFIAQVREKNSAVIAIAVSAYFTAADRRRVHEAGFDMYFPKPVDLLDLRVVLSRMDSHPARNGNGANGSTPLRSRS
jgi:CheY-like chemotaxis protein